MSGAATFTPSNPVDPARFIGRDGLLSWICGKIRTRQSVYLCGGPRIGKTSLLNKLVHDGIPPGEEDASTAKAQRYLFGKLSAHELSESHSPLDFWTLLFNDAEERAQELGVWECFEQALKPPEVSTGIGSLLKNLKNGHITLVLLLDELETLVKHPLFPGSFFNQLRAWVDKGMDLVVVSCSRERKTALERYLVEKKDQSGSQAFNLGDERILGTFNRKEAGELLLHGGISKPHPEFPTLTWELTGGHPYLLHLLGDRWNEQPDVACLKSLLEGLSAWGNELWRSVAEKEHQAYMALLAAAQVSDAALPTKVSLRAVSTHLRPHGLANEAASSDPESPFPALLSAWMLQKRSWCHSPEEEQRLNSERIGQISARLVQLVDGDAASDTLRTFARDIELKTEQINFDGSAKVVLDRVLEEANKVGKVPALVQRIAREYPEAPESKTLLEDLGHPSPALLPILQPLERMQMLSESEALEWSERLTAMLRQSPDEFLRRRWEFHLPRGGT